MPSASPRLARNRSDYVQGLIANRYGLPAGACARQPELPQKIAGCGAVGPIPSEDSHAAVRHRAGLAAGAVSPSIGSPSRGRPGPR